MFVQRAMSAVVIVAATALFVYLGGMPFALFIAALAAIASYEFCRMLDQRHIAPLAPVVIIATLAFVANAYLHAAFVAPLALLVVLLPLAWLVIAGPRPPAATAGPPAGVGENLWPDVLRWAFTSLGALYIGLPLSYFVLLRDAPAPGFAAWPDGLWWTVLAILGTWASDTGGYLTGMFFGRRPFMAHISPKKTIEGAIGSVFWPTVVTVALGMWLLAIPAWHGIALGILIGCASILGDLGESVLKRGTGVKDTGAIIPGHGGILDRLDSLIFTGPLVYYYMMLVIGG